MSETSNNKEGRNEMAYGTVGAIFGAVAAGPAGAIVGGLASWALADKVVSNTMFDLEK